MPSPNKSTPKSQHRPRILKTTICIILVKRMLQSLKAADVTGHFKRGQHENDDLCELKPFKWKMKHVTFISNSVVKPHSTHLEI